MRNAAQIRVEDSPNLDAGRRVARDERNVCLAVPECQKVRG